MPRGVAIGVLGDPNSGKSVFTYLLFREMVRAGVRVFRQEGDPSAPTGPWYLESEVPEVAHTLRKRLKSPWDWRKVEWVRDSVQALKNSFDFVLVDLGGGMPPHKRVTPELKEILKSIDEVVLLCPSEKAGECFAAWEKELREEAPHVRVALKCVSDLNAKRSVVEPEKGVCVITGLDRRLASAPRPETVEGIDRVMEWLASKKREIVVA